MIALENICKTYGEKESLQEVLKQVNLTVQKGEFLALMGVSGSGKTTLLNILGGMDTATSGTYRFEEIDVTGLSLPKLHEFRKNHVSFVFQHFYLMDHYTVYENIELPLLARQAKNRKETILALLSELSITDCRDKLPDKISGGQKQRCAIARALAADTPLILADEPTGALDASTAKEVMEIFVSLKKKGKTIIMVTHDEVVAAYADRVVKISDGRLIE